MSALGILLVGTEYVVNTASTALSAGEDRRATYDSSSCDLLMPELMGLDCIASGTTRSGPPQAMIFLTGDTLSSETTIFSQERRHALPQQPFRAADAGESCSRNYKTEVY